jgi:hypothetical protein
MLRVPQRKDEDQGALKLVEERSAPANAIQGKPWRSQGSAPGLSSQKSKHIRRLKKKKKKKGQGLAGWSLTPCYTKEFCVHNFFLKKSQPSTSTQRA